MHFNIDHIAFRYWAFTEISGRIITPLFQSRLSHDACNVTVTKVLLHSNAEKQEVETRYSINKLWSVKRGLKVDFPNASSATWDNISYCLINKEFCRYNIFVPFSPTGNSFYV